MTPLTLYVSPICGSLSRNPVFYYCVTVVAHTNTYGPEITAPKTDVTLVLQNLIALYQRFIMSSIKQN